MNSHSTRVVGNHWARENTQSSCEIHTKHTIETRCFRRLEWWLSTRHFSVRLIFLKPFGTKLKKLQKTVWANLTRGSDEGSEQEDREEMKEAGGRRRTLHSRSKRHSNWGANQHRHSLLVHSHSQPSTGFMPDSDRAQTQGVVPVYISRGFCRRHRHEVWNKKLRKWVNPLSPNLVSH